MKTDRRRPKRQVCTWKPDDYTIQLEQVGHTAYRLTEHDGIRVVAARDYRDPDAAQQAFIDAQTAYLFVLAEFTLAPLPEKPSQIIVIEDGDE